MPFLAWLKQMFGSTEFNANAALRLDFLNDKSSGVKTSVKPKTKLVFKNKGDVHVIQVHGDVTPEVAAQLTPVREAYQNGDIVLVTDEQKKTLSDVLAHERQPEIASLLTFFKPKISQHDYQLLRTGLYLKQLRETHKVEESSRVWSKTVQSASARDKRVINLASAGYFASYFRPLYNQLMREGNARQLFDQAYNEAIDEMRFAIFAYKELTKDELVQLVLHKAAKNLRYGVNEDIIYIHATGPDAVRVVEEAIAELQPKFPKVRLRKQSGRGYIIKASVYYKDNQLTAEDLGVEAGT